MRLLPDFTSSIFDADMYVVRDYATGGRHLNMRGWIAIAVLALACVAPFGFFPV